RLDAVRGVMRARVDATRLCLLHAEIAARRLVPRARDQAPGLRRIGDLHRERVQIQIAIRTAADAEAAPDAPVLDGDFHRVAATRARFMPARSLATRPSSARSAGNSVSAR